MVKASLSELPRHHQWWCAEPKDLSKQAESWKIHVRKSTRVCFGCFGEALLEWRQRITSDAEWQKLLLHKAVKLIQAIWRPMVETENRQQQRGKIKDWNFEVTFVPVAIQNPVESVIVAVFTFFTFFTTLTHSLSSDLWHHFSEVGVISLRPAVRLDIQVIIISSLPPSELERKMNLSEHGKWVVLISLFRRCLWLVTLWQS